MLAAGCDSAGDGFAPSLLVVAGDWGLLQAAKFRLIAQTIAIPILVNTGDTSARDFFCIDIL
ncbi:hypothetical protein ENHY17A_110156 [Moraxellaceae bacterium 17A]|nr:hypothetical protein ENHY17A_110156 [Moraxellaceae bacterium 17A]